MRKDHQVVDDVTGQLNHLALTFTQRPILIGGNAMEYYGLREAGADIDLVICDNDYSSLEKQYPGERKDLYGDLGIVLWPLEIWRSIALLDYDFYKRNANEYASIVVVSFERLLFMRVIAREVEKYNHDLEVMVEHVYTNQRNKKYLNNAETHIGTYQKQNGVVFAGNYDD